MKSFISIRLISSIQFISPNHNFYQNQIRPASLNGSMYIKRQQNTLTSYPTKRLGPTPATKHVLSYKEQAQTNKIPLLEPICYLPLKRFIELRLEFKPFYSVNFSTLYKDYVFHTFSDTDLQLFQKYSSPEELYSRVTCKKSPEKIEGIISKKKFSKVFLWLAQQNVSYAIKKIKVQNIVFQGVGLTFIVKPKKDKKKSQ